MKVTVPLPNHTGIRRINHSCTLLLVVPVLNLYILSNIINNCLQERCLPLAGWFKSNDKE